MALQNFDIADRTYGIEIEFIGGDRHAMARIMNANGVPAQVEGYNHTTRSHWKLITDASCGYEAVSPILRGEDGFRQIRVACQAIVAAGGSVNINCGLHVHFGTNDLDFAAIQRFVKNYIKFEDSIDCLMPASRRDSNNRWCRSISGQSAAQDEATKVDTINRAMEMVDAATDMNSLRWAFPQRYSKLNLNAYWVHGTLEVRQHSGTLDAEKIINWTRLLGALMAASKSQSWVGKRKVNGQTAKFRLKWLFNMTIQGDVRRFFSSRARKLARA